MGSFTKLFTERKADKCGDMGECVDRTRCSCFQWAQKRVFWPYTNRLSDAQRREINIGTALAEYRARVSSKS